MRATISILLIYLTCLAHTSATTWYAAADGNSTNGTSLLPWSIPYAFTNGAGNPHIQAGDVVLFQTGTYYPTNQFYDNGENSFTNSIAIRPSGVIYKSESLWGFRLKGGLQIPASGAVSNVTVSGMVFDLSRFRNYTNAWEEIFGVNIWGGNNNQVLHCLMENNSGGGVGRWRTASNSVIAGNIIRFNGAADWTERYAVGVFQRGSGLYLENENGTAIFTGNIVYHNHTHGFSIKSYIDGFSLTNNAVSGLLSHSISLENNDTPTRGINIVSNFVWRGMPGTSGLQLGYNWYSSGTHTESYGNSNMFVLGNYIVGSLKGISIVNAAKQATVRTNFVVRLGTSGDGGSAFATEYNTFGIEPTAPVNSPSYTLQGNTYFSPTATDNNFMYWGSLYSPANWTSTAGDVDPDFNIGAPTSLDVYVFRPSTNSAFAHVVVYNWQTNASTAVDLSSYFPSGSQLSIYDAQNIPAAFTNLVYAGGNVALPLTLTNRATMHGDFDSPAPAWTGFDERFRAFVVYQNPATTLNVTTLNISGNLIIGP